MLGLSPQDERDQRTQHGDNDARRRLETARASVAQLGITALYGAVLGPALLG